MRQYLPPPPGRDLVAYVSGPYRAPSESRVAANIQAAREIAMALWEMGLTVLCPHLNSAFMGGVCPDDWFLAGDLVLLGRSDLLVLHPAWEDSTGSREEVQEARRLGLPLYVWPAARAELERLANHGTLPCPERPSGGILAGGAEGGCDG